MWKIRKTFKDKNGRVNVAGKNKLMTKARYTMIKVHGNKALKFMEVHHKNFNCTDDRLENLQILTPEEHRELHRNNKGDLSPTIF